MEKGKYPYYEEVARGRRRHCDGSPPVTRPDDVPISEGYGMDPIDFARAQSWQQGLTEKGVYVTRDGMNQAVGTDNSQSIPTSGSVNGITYTSPQLPSFMPTRKVVPKPRPIIRLPQLAHDAQCTNGRPVSPVSPLSADNVQDNHNRTRDYRDVSPLRSPTMPRTHSGWL
jgi:hypothetical protein